MCCRDRWRGREAEGFGIVFLEAAACGVPAVAGRSGGSHEAVADGETGFVVAPRDVTRDTRRDCPAGRRSMRCGSGWATRRAAVRWSEFDYDRLVADLAVVARGDLSAVGPLCR